MVNKQKNVNCHKESIFSAFMFGKTQLERVLRTGSFIKNKNLFFFYFIILIQCLSDLCT